MFYQTLIPPQVNRWEIITYKHGIFDLPHELLNDLKLNNVVNQEILEKCLNFIQSPPGGSPPSQNKGFVTTIKKVTKNND